MLVQSGLGLVLLVGLAHCLPQSRVVNGTDTDIRAYPFVVSLRGIFSSHSCAATIINEYWLLTAAHCVVDTFALLISIQYGVTKIGKLGPNIASVKCIFVHENYDEITISNDIALLRLRHALILNNDNVAAVTLPAQNFEVPPPLENVAATLVGWGLEKTGGSVQKNLQKVDLQFYSDEQCFDFYPLLTTEDQLCSGVDGGGKGPCNGDSGGPLLYSSNVQLGIVSWGLNPCGSTPGVFTKVSHYVDWISTTIQKNCG